MNLTKTSTSGVMNYHADEDEYYYHLVKKTKEFNPLLRQWVVTKTEKLEPILASKHDDLQKNLTINILFRKSGLDETTMERKYGIFTEKVKLSIKPKHSWLRLVDGQIMVNNLKTGVSQPITLNEAFKLNVGEIPLCNIKRIKSSRKRMTSKEALELFKEPNTLRDFYDESFEGELRVVGYYDKHAKANPFVGFETTLKRT